MDKKNTGLAGLVFGVASVLGCTQARERVEYSCQINLDGRKTNVVYRIEQDSIFDKEKIIIKMNNEIYVEVNNQLKEVYFESEKIYESYVREENPLDVMLFLCPPIMLISGPIEIINNELKESAKKYSMETDSAFWEKRYFDIIQSLNGKMKITER